MRITKIIPASTPQLTRRDMLKTGIRGALGASLCLGLGPGGCRKTTRRPKLNVFLITVDTLRADHLGCYGYRRATTPSIDAFAQESLLFENCLSHAPVTSSSLASLLSGFYPHETTVYRNWPLPKPLKIIPDLLAGAGYKTAAVVSNYMLSQKNGWGSHFMTYDDQMTDFEKIRSMPERIAEHTTDRAIEVIKGYRNDPLFLWVHYQDPHGPYTPPEKFQTMFLEETAIKRDLPVNASLSGRGGIPSYQKLEDHRDYHYYVALYDGEIFYMDQQVGRLLQTMKQLGVYDDALIIFSSDHGEGMGEHEYYFAHGECLYQNMLHVPLIIKQGASLQGRRSDPVEHIDVLPTLCAATGIKTTLPLRGSDLRQKATAVKERYAAMNSPMVKDSVKISLVRENLKLIYTVNFKTFELYDLTSDPAEKDNLANKELYQPYLRQMTARLLQLANENRLKITAPSKNTLSEEEKRKLESLGYVE